MNTQLITRVLPTLCVHCMHWRCG